jgi:outer membrane protein TolC
MRPSIRCIFFSGWIFTSAVAGPAAPPATVAPLCTLSLVHSFELARNGNAALKASVDAIQMTKGEELSALSRLLPHLNVVYRRSKADSLNSNFADDQTLDLELRQRLGEFGQTTDAEYARLRNKRKAFYGRESEIIKDFSAIRVSYFSLRIIKEQLATHDSLLALYRDKLGQEQARLNNGVGHKPALLQARLNFLEERERIIGLERQRTQQLAALRQLLGWPAMSDSVKLTTVPSPLPLSADTSIALAMRNSVEIADTRGEAELEKRKLIETGWTIAPDIHVTAGYQNGPSTAALELSNNQPDARHTWAVDAVGSRSLVSSGQPPANQYDLQQYPNFTDTTTRYTASVAISLPIFKGLKRVGDAIQAGAAYNQARDIVLSKTHDLEKSVLSAYYDYQLSSEDLAIQKEKVDIARERYDLALTESEVGKISDVDVDIYRRGVFSSQDNFFAKQFEVLSKEETLRQLVRQLE